MSENHVVLKHGRSIHVDSFDQILDRLLLHLHSGASCKLDHREAVWTRRACASRAGRCSAGERRREQHTFEGLTRVRASVIWEPVTQIDIQSVPKSCSGELWRCRPLQTQPCAQRPRATARHAAARRAPETMHLPPAGTRHSHVLCCELACVDVPTTTP